MTQLDLPRLRELALKATPGPWKAGGTIYRHMIAEIRSVLPGSERGIGLIWQHANGFADAQFIAAANPATFLALLDLAESAGRMMRAIRNHLQARDALERAPTNNLLPDDARFKAVRDTLEEMKAVLSPQSTEGEEGQ